MTMAGFSNKDLLSTAQSGAVPDGLCSTRIRHGKSKNIDPALRLAMPVPVQSFLNLSLLTRFISANFSPYSFSFLAYLLLKQAEIHVAKTHKMPMEAKK